MQFPSQTPILPLDGASAIALPQAAFDPVSCVDAAAGWASLRSSIVPERAGPHSRSGNYRSEIRCADCCPIARPIRRSVHLASTCSHQFAITTSEAASDETNFHAGLALHDDLAGHRSSARTLGRSLRRSIQNRGAVPLCRWSKGWHVSHGNR
jgi:hypothetical protein